MVNLEDMGWESPVFYHIGDNNMVKVKNISGKTLNLKGGPCKSKCTAEVEFDEAKFLFSQGFVQAVVRKKAKKK